MAARRNWIAAGLAALAALAGLAVWVRCGPLPKGLLDPERWVSTQIVDRNGELLYESLSEKETRSRRLDPERLPETLSRATVAAEDRRFFLHPGVDPIALARALWRNLRAGGVVEGGSTLTQQVVKQLLPRRGLLAGKLREAVYALRLEHRLTKREILGLYLNLAPYGNQYTGAASAAAGYFGCPPENLTAAQAAFLAGLPQRPAALDPYRHLDSALARQRVVLGRMRSRGFLSEAEARVALAERLKLAREAPPLTAPHFVATVRAKFPASDPPRRIKTTLDAPLQREVQAILAAHRKHLEKHGAHNAAVVVLENATGEWLAWEGSGDYFDEDHGGAIDGAAAPRQPGSALKPFTYALAFDRGFTPASVLPDLPAHFETAVPGILYEPRNYDGVFRGPLRARAALAGSENVPAVWLLSRIGVARELALLRRAGLTTFDRTADYYGYALTMGDAEVRLFELTAAYSSFARGGVFFAPKLVRRWTSSNGEVREAASSKSERLFSERAAFWVSDILSDARARAYIFGSGGSLDFPFPVAVKTGTSQGYHDNWTIGFTREVTVGVWVGNFDRKELRNSSGVTGAAPIFHAVMEAAEKRALGRFPTEADPPLATAPPELSRGAICALSGMPATEACPSAASEWLAAGERAAACTWHRRRGRTAAVAWPAQYRAWARERGLASTAHSDEPASASETVLRIENPPPKAIYLRDPTLPEHYQTLALKAVAPGAARTLLWEVDGKVVGSARSDEPLDWPLAPGHHTIAVAAGDLREETTIVVK
jgi:penicillin-binding protein 1C